MNMNNLSMQFSRLSFSALLLSIVAACGGAGGDSGEVVPDDAAIEAVAPLVAVWDLPDNWDGAGATGDKTYLAVESPGSDGVSVATIYELADAGTGDELNCYLTNNKGEIGQLLNKSLYLDLPVYNSAIVALTPDGKLQISDFAVGAASTSEPELVFLATRSMTTQMTINELPLC